MVLSPIFFKWAQLSRVRHRLVSKFYTGTYCRPGSKVRSVSTHAWTRCSAMWFLSSNLSWSRKCVRSGSESLICGCFLSSVLRSEDYLCNPFHKSHSYNFQGDFRQFRYLNKNWRHKLLRHHHLTIRCTSDCHEARLHLHRSLWSACCQHRILHGFYSQNVSLRFSSPSVHLYPFVPVARFSDLQETSQAISIRSLFEQTAAAEFTTMILQRSRRGWIGSGKH